MGIDERYEGSRSRGEAPRRRPAYENSDPTAGRSSYRGARDEGARPRPRGADEDPYAARASNRRGIGPEDGRDPRYDRGGPRSRPDQSTPSGRRPRIEGDESGPRRERRPDADVYARGASSRGQRPRDDWDTSARPRNPRGPAPGPGDSAARMRRPNPAAAANTRGGGGIWGDGASATTIRGRPDPRDPRARRGASVAEEEDEGGAGVGKALGAIIFALILGAGAAYGYYTVSTPKLAPSLAQPSASPTAGPSTSPTPHTTATPHADRGPASSPVTAQASGAYVFVTSGTTPRV